MVLLAVEAPVQLAPGRQEQLAAVVVLVEPVEAAVDAAVAEVGATSIRDMGKVMGILKGKYMGQMDFGSVGPIVKDRLCS